MSRYLFLLALAVAAFFSSTEVQAAKPDYLGPDVIKFKMGATKTIDFSHHRHQKLVNNQCWECHDKKLGVIDNWGKEAAHKLCIACHDLLEKGPVGCKGCHKK
ncbi:MAG: cytochrome c, 3 heme-binding site [Deltaproteobacteria bacterium]|nr:cytochrome c, 3 heme-binding site [Deltaproteobacteria bacterium]